MLAPHPWMAACRDLLLSSLSSLQGDVRRMGAEAISKICIVSDIDYVKGYLTSIQVLNTALNWWTRPQSIMIHIPVPFLVLYLLLLVSNEALILEVEKSLIAPVLICFWDILSLLNNHFVWLFLFDLIL